MLASLANADRLEIQGMPEKTTGLGFSRGLFLEPYLTGCFPPKPPVRSLIHSDHRRARQKQQEYRGNKRKTYIPPLRCPPAGRTKRGETRQMAQEKTLASLSVIVSGRRDVGMLRLYDGMSGGGTVSLCRKKDRKHGPGMAGYNGAAQSDAAAVLPHDFP